MDQLRLTKPLNEIVSKISDSEFKPKYQLHSQEKVWQMYVRDTQTVLQSAYLSDHCELFLTETFRETGTKTSEEQAITSILSTYKKHIDTIEEKSKTNPSVLTTYMIVGGLGGLVLMRHPFGALIGAGAGYLAYEGIKDLGVKKAVNALENYLGSHNVYLGSKALQKISRG